MIVARVMGGLGNQLFIYAAARALALRTGRPLKLDLINGFSEDAFGRAYLLDRFPIQSAPATSDEVSAYRLHSPSLRRRRKLNRFLPRNWRDYYEERGLFDAHFPTLAPRRTNLYLEGYWQREAYFIAASAQIRAELTPQGPLPPASQELATHINQTESVCVHIRRQNYAHVLDSAYYQRALAHLTPLLSHPVFFIFSDDPAWAQQNIRPTAETIHVDSDTSPAGALRDFQLMTRCRHHIVANSTFSWWGAWLAAHPDQEVVAPSRWGYRAAPAANWTVIPN